MPWEWPFTNNGLYQPQDWPEFGNDQAAKDSYDNMFKIVSYMYPLWAQVSAYEQFINKSGNDKKTKARMRESLEAAVVKYTRSGFPEPLPMIKNPRKAMNRTTFGTCRDLMPNTAEPMRQLKDEFKLDYTIWDEGYAAWWGASVEPLNLPRSLEPIWVDDENDEDDEDNDSDSDSDDESDGDEDEGRSKTLTSKKASKKEKEHKATSEDVDQAKGKGKDENEDGDQDTEKTDKRGKKTRRIPKRKSNNRAQGRESRKIRSQRTKKGKDAAQNESHAGGVSPEQWTQQSNEEEMHAAAIHSVHADILRVAYAETSLASTGPGYLLAIRDHALHQLAQRMQDPDEPQDLLAAVHRMIDRGNLQAPDDVVMADVDATGDHNADTMECDVAGDAPGDFTTDPQSYENLLDPRLFESSGINNNGSGNTMTHDTEFNPTEEETSQIQQFIDVFQTPGLQGFEGIYGMIFNHFRWNSASVMRAMIGEITPLAHQANATRLAFAQLQLCAMAARFGPAPRPVRIVNAITSFPGGFAANPSSSRQRAVFFRGRFKDTRKDRNGAGRMK